MVTENNHFHGMWDDQYYYIPERKDYNICLGKTSTILPFKNAVINTAKNIHKSYSNINLFLSGGFDSNVALLGFLYNQIKPNIKIFKYEDNINLFDVQMSIAICNKYNLDYEIFNINIKDFLNSQCLQYASQIFTKDPWFALLLMITQKHVNTNSMNIFGIGDFEFKYDRNKKIYFIKEREYLGRLNLICKNYIPFYRYDPVIMKSWLLDQQIINFVNDIGFTSDWNKYKSHFYRQHFPELSDRKKLTGFEPIQLLFDSFEPKVRKLMDSYNIDKKFLWQDYVNLLS